MADRPINEESHRLLDGPSAREKRTTLATLDRGESVTWRSLPNKKQILLLSLCRLSAPLSNACLLPYLYYLVKSILSDPEHPSAPQKISRLTGFLVAAYPLGQVATSMLWGRLSDTHGRKPIILTGLLVSVVANLCFGFSRSIGMLLFWRVLAGMANGTIGVMRTMTAEIVKEKRHQPRAFLAPPVVFNSGRVAALAIGGCLADPVQNIPSLFGTKGFFNIYNGPAGVEWTLEYPYALPAIFNGIVLGMCSLLATLWLKESLATKEGEPDLGIMAGQWVSRFIKTNVLRRVDYEYTPIQIEELDVAAPTFSVLDLASTPSGTAITSEKRARRLRFREIWTSHLIKTLFAFALLPLHNSTFLHIFPVFLSMPSVTNILPTVFEFSGGLGLSSPTVGLYLASFGICGILLQLFLYPRIQQRIGNIGAFRLASSIFPLAYLFAPYLALLSEDLVAKWPAMAVILFAQVIARTMAIPSSVILLTRAAPHKSVMGTVHGAGNTVSAIASACGPVIGGMLLAWGIEKGLVGFVWWAWMCAISLVAFGWSFALNRSEDEEKIMVDNGVE